MTRSHCWQHISGKHGEPLKYGEGAYCSRSIPGSGCPRCSPLLCTSTDEPLELKGLALMLLQSERKTAEGTAFTQYSHTGQFRRTREHTSIQHLHSFYRTKPQGRQWPRGKEIKTAARSSIDSTLSLSLLSCLCFFFFVSRTSLGDSHRKKRD